MKKGTTPENLLPGTVQAVPDPENGLKPFSHNPRRKIHQL